MKAVAILFDAFDVADVKNTALSLVLRGLGVIVSLLTSILVIRVLGQEDAGLFFLGLACVTPVALISRLGADMAITKVVAKSHRFQIRPLYRSLLPLALGLCGAMGLLASYCSEYLAVGVFRKPDLSAVLSWMMWSVIGQSVAAVVACFFQGMNRINHYLLFGSLLSPICFLVLFLWGVLTFGDITVLDCAKAYVLGAWLAAAAAIISMELTLIDQTGEDSSVIEPLREIAALIPSLLGMVVLQQVMGWLPQLMLGVFRSSSEVTSLAVAVRVSNLIAIVLVAVNGVLAPKFAKLFADDQLEELRMLAQRFTRWMAIACMPLLLLEIVFPTLLMKIFGIDTKAAATMLAVLAIGQLVNIASGSVGLLLNMCGQQVTAFWCNVFSSMLLVCTSFALIPVFGGVGAAIAQTLSVISCMVCLSVISWRTLGFAPAGGLKLNGY